MFIRKAILGMASVAAVGGMVAADVAIAAETIFIPALVYRTGPYAPGGIPSANGIKDYVTLINERDGGVNGVMLELKECETQYNTKIGVECYEKFKSKKPVVIFPYSTGITYQLIPKSPVDKIPIFSMGYGRTSAADGRVFKWVFNFPTTYWNQASAVINYMGLQEGGLDKLKGMKIAHIYHNSAYGKEANPTLEILSKKFGYELKMLAVDHPGQEQKATWLQIRRWKPKYMFLSGWGVMNQVALKSAAEIGFPMDHFIGNWWSGTEVDMGPVGDVGHGYKSATFHAPGGKSKLHDDIRKYVYDRGKGAGVRERVGEVLYNRAVLNMVFVIEAIKKAQKKFGVKVVTGTHVRWGLENTHITPAGWEKIGLSGYPEIKVTCEDHEGAHPVLFQQWDAKVKEWKIVSDWIPVMRDITRPLIEADAAKFAKENNITPRDCSKEG
jgi:branched-chain amino acid transport system substrate-binding protein